MRTDDRRNRRVAAAAHEKVSSTFCEEKIVPLYEAYYEEIASRGDLRSRLEVTSQLGMPVAGLSVTA